MQQKTSDIEALEISIFQNILLIPVLNVLNSERPLARPVVVNKNDVLQAIKNDLVAIINIYEASDPFTITKIIEQVILDLNSIFEKYQSQSSFLDDPKFKNPPLLLDVIIKNINAHLRIPNFTLDILMSYDIDGPSFKQFILRKGLDSQIKTVVRTGLTQDVLRDLIKQEVNSAADKLLFPQRPNTNYLNNPQSNQPMLVHNNLNTMNHPSMLFGSPSSVGLPNDNLLSDSSQWMAKDQQL